MALSNTAVPKYYGMFRDAVIRREISVCETVSLEMNRIDQLIDNPRYWYDDRAVEGFIHYCENELTLTDGSDLYLLDSFKLWAEQIFGWYYFIERSVFIPSETGSGGHYEMTITKNVPSEVYDRISKSQTLIDQISAYIDDPMTATTFRNDPSKRGSREGITAELIYYWMISQGIPVEFEKWHINSLLTLIRVCNVKNSPGKKMSAADITRRNEALNKARRAKHHSKG